MSTSEPADIDLLPSYPAGTCLACGACCHSFRVSFYWGEILALGLPAELTLKVNPWLACMAGTHQPPRRCCALDGRVGQAVRCRVYPARPSPCREVEPGDGQCARARALHGLPPLRSIDCNG